MIAVIGVTCGSACVICGSILRASDAEQWKEFTSTKYHFTVQYPASWYRLGDTPDILDITNFQRARPQEGIATTAAGAEITVSGALPGVETVDDWIHRDLPDSDDIAASEGTVPVPKPAPGSCKKLKQATWRQQVSPDVYFTNTAYYCVADAGLYKVAIMNWQSDPNQGRLRALALQIALSLRTQPAPN
ncbi:MAG TPA: hypothetical protein VI455_15090 [Terriglobia bacterium]